MGTESIQVSGVINATPERIYYAWLDSAEHSAFTGGTATIEPGVGGRFTAGDGSVTGTTVDLEPGRRIVQHWRSNDFPPDSHDSRLEVILEVVPEGTKVTLLHTDIPEGLAAKLEQGWREYYLGPMAKHFGSAAGGEDFTGEEAEVLAEEADEEVTPKATAAPRKKPAPKKAPKAKARAKKKAAPKKKKAAKKKAAKKKAAKKAKASKRKGGRGAKKRARRR